MSFVEQATLIVRDNSTANLRKINSAINKLESSARKLAGAFKSIKPANFSKAISEAKKLETTLNALSRKKINPLVKIDTNAARTAINAIKAKPITISVRADVRYAKAAIMGLKAKPITVLVNAATTTAQNRINRMSAKPINVTVNALTNKAQQKINTIAAKPVKVNVTANTALAMASIRALGMTRVRITPTINTQTVQQSLNNVKFTPKMVTGPFKEIGRVIGQEISRAIVSGAQQAIGEGFKNLDIAETRLGLQDIPAADRQTLQSAAVQNSEKKDTPFSRVQSLGILSELYQTASRNAKAAEGMLPSVNKLGAAMALVGITSDESANKMATVIKTFETMGKVTDKNGNIDLKALNQQTDLYVKGLAAIGKEMTPELFEKTMRAAQVTKTTLNDEGFLSLLFAAEELKHSAGVGLNQAVKNLSGTASKKAISKQIEYGLAVAREIETGSVDGKSVKEIVVESVDEDLLRANPFQFGAKYLLPAMEKAGLDPNNSVDAAKFAQQIASERTAVAQIANIIGRSAENQRQVAQAMQIRTDADKMQGVVDQSGMFALTKTFGDITSAAGTAASSLEGIFIPALNKIAEGARAIEQFIAPEGVQDPKKTGVVAGAGLLGGLGAIFGASKLLQAFTGIGANTAATSLNTAALGANTAALSVLAGGAVAGATTTTTTAAAAAASTSLASKAKSFFSQGLKVLTGVGATLLGVEALKTVDPEGNLGGLTSGLDKFVKDLTGFDPSKDFDPNTIAKNQLEALGQPGLLDELNTVLEAQLKAFDQPGLLTGSGTAIAAAVQKIMSTPFTGTGDRITNNGKPIPVSVVNEIADAKKQAAMEVAAGVPQTVFPGKIMDDNAVGAQITAATDIGATTITTAANSGATAITNAGTTAGGTIATSVSGAGAAIGSALNAGAATVGAAIRAALAAGVQVNVSGNVSNDSKPLNTGNASLPAGVR